MKTPRLKFYGIECTRQELQTLRMVADCRNWDIGFDCGPAKCRVLKMPFSADGSFAKHHSDTLLGLVEKGVFTLKKGVYYWTLLGTQYFFKVARNNKHLRFFKSRKYEERQAKRAASRAHKIV